MSSTALTYEGRIDPESHPEFQHLKGTLLVTIGGWKTVADLAAYVTRRVRRSVAKCPPFSGGPPRRFDLFSYDTLKANERWLNGEPDALKLNGPVTLLLTKRVHETPVADLGNFKSRFDAGDFDFEHLRRLIAKSTAKGSRRSASRARR